MDANRNTRTGVSILFIQYCFGRTPFVEMKGLHTESIFSVVGANDILKPGTSFSVSFISTHSSDMPEFRMTSTGSALCRYFRSKSLTRWVYTFDAVKRFDTLSYASQMRIKTFYGVSVYTFHAGISARQRARESVARRKMLQSSTVLNFHALRQRTQAIEAFCSSVYSFA